MKKKFLALMISTSMLAGILPTISLAATIDGEITFVNASEYKTVAEFSENDRICARIEGSAEGNANADVYAASYKEGELLSCTKLFAQPVMDGMQLDVVSDVINIASGADEIRVYAWDMKDNMKDNMDSNKESTTSHNTNYNNKSYNNMKGSSGKDSRS